MTTVVHRVEGFIVCKRGNLRLVKQNENSSHGAKFTASASIFIYLAVSGDPSRDSLHGEITSPITRM